MWSVWVSVVLGSLRPRECENDHYTCGHVICMGDWGKGLSKPGGCENDHYTCGHGHVICMGDWGIGLSRPAECENDHYTCGHGHVICMGDWVIGLSRLAECENDHYTCGSICSVAYKHKFNRVKLSSTKCSCMTSLTHTYMWNSPRYLSGATCVIRPFMYDYQVNYVFYPPSANASIKSCVWNVTNAPFLISRLPYYP